MCFLLPNNLVWTWVYTHILYDKQKKIDDNVKPYMTS